MLTALWGFVTAWYNLPFSLLLVAALALAAMQLTGLHAEADSEADLDDEADEAADADSEAEAPRLAWLTQLGFGRAPLTVLLFLFFSLIGAAGLALHALWLSVAGDLPALALALTLPLAGLTGGIAAAQAARGLGRALPPVSTTATRASALVGRLGTVISPRVDEAYGQVRVRNPGGTQLSVFAVTKREAPIPRGQPVVVVAYDDAARRYIVTAALSDHRPP